MEQWNNGMMERLLENQIIPLVIVEKERKERLNTFLTKLLRMRWSVALLSLFLLPLLPFFYRNDFNCALLSSFYQLKHDHLRPVSLYVYMV